MVEEVVAIKNKSPVALQLCQASCGSLRLSLDLIDPCLIVIVFSVKAVELFAKAMDLPRSLISSHSCLSHMCVNDEAKIDKGCVALELLELASALCRFCCDLADLGAVVLG